MTDDEINVEKTRIQNPKNSSRSTFQSDVVSLLCVLAHIQAAADSQTTAASAK